MKIAILTGAGISAESGIPTFRDKGGIWEKYDIYKVATEDAYLENRNQVIDFFNEVRKSLDDKKPNDAHHKLIDLESRHEVTIITQNIDNLHEMAGSVRVLHIHGDITQSRCDRCGFVEDVFDDIPIDSECKNCLESNSIRPNVVLFGEDILYEKEIMNTVNQCDLFISIGTSNTVSPATQLIHKARKHGARTVELNLESTDITRKFSEYHHGPATEVVPEFVKSLLGEFGDREAQRCIVCEKVVDNHGECDSNRGVFTVGYGSEYDGYTVELSICDKCIKSRHKRNLIKLDGK